MIRYPHAPPSGSRLLIGLLLSAEKGTALHDQPRRIRIGKDGSLVTGNEYCMHFVHNLMRKASARQEISRGRGRTRFPGKSTVENGALCRRLKRCSTPVNRNNSRRKLPFGPAGGGIGKKAIGERDATPRWVGALRSWQSGGALGGNFRRFVNRTESKTDTDPVGGALPPAVRYAFRWSTAGRRAPKGPSSLVPCLRRRQSDPVSTER